MKRWPRPDLSVLLIATCLLVLGVTLSLLAMTNGLTESPFQGRYVMMWAIQVGAFATWFTLLLAWLRGRHAPAEG